MSNQAIPEVGTVTAAALQEVRGVQECKIDATPRKHVDSGYASLQDTPIRGKKLVVHGSGLCSRSSSQWEPTELSVSPEGLPKTVRDQCSDLIYLHYPRLLEALSKTPNRKRFMHPRFGSKRMTSPTSMKLKALIAAEPSATATPWVVVFCDVSHRAQVEAFFLSTFVRNAFQPATPDEDHATFGIMIQKAPLLLAKALAPTLWSRFEHATAEQNEAAGGTLCGSVLRISHEDGTRHTTIGGVVRCVEYDGCVSYYLMTVSHGLESVTSPRSNSIRSCSIFDTGTETYDAPGCNHDSSDNERGAHYDGTTGQDAVYTHVTTHRTLPDGADISERLRSLTEEFNIRHENEPQNDTCDAMPDNGYEEPWYIVGPARLTSSDPHIFGPDLDWALLETPYPHALRPNLIPDLAPFRNSINQPAEVSGDFETREVKVLKSVGGIANGEISFDATSFCANPERGCFKAYTLKLEDSWTFSTGDSGAWVVDSFTSEVYGHIVAADDFGEAYVVPLKDSFRQMKEALNVLSVSLPRSLDLPVQVADQWCMNHDRTETIAQPSEIVTMPASDAAHQDADVCSGAGLTSDPQESRPDDRVEVEAIAESSSPPLTPSSKFRFWPKKRDQVLEVQSPDKKESRIRNIFRSAKKKPKDSVKDNEEGLDTNNGRIDRVLTRLENRKKAKQRLHQAIQNENSSYLRSPTAKPSPSLPEQSVGFYSPHPRFYVPQPDSWSPPSSQVMSHKSSIPSFTDSGYGTQQGSPQASCGASPPSSTARSPWRSLRSSSTSAGSSLANAYDAPPSGPPNNLYATSLPRV